MILKPFLWYESYDEKSQEVREMKALLASSNTDYIDSSPAVDVGWAHVRVGKARFYGVQGVSEFIRMKKQGTLEKFLQFA